MSKSDKLLKSMANNPQGGFVISDIQVVSRAFGLSIRNPSGGSHYSISHSSQVAILTIPARRPIKPIYIRQFVAYVQAVEASRDHGSSPVQDRD
jgi:hypothetical protein